MGASVNPGKCTYSAFVAEVVEDCADVSAQASHAYLHIHAHFMHCMEIFSVLTGLFLHGAQACRAVSLQLAGICGGADLSSPIYSVSRDNCLGMGRCTYVPPLNGELEACVDIPNHDAVSDLFIEHTQTPATIPGYF